MVSAPSYLLHSQKQVYKLIGKCQTHSRLVKHTLTFPASEADERIGSSRERESKRNREETIDGRDRNDTAKMRQKEEVEGGVTEQEEEIEMEIGRRGKIVGTTAELTDIL